MLLAQSCGSPFVCIDGDQVIGNSKVFTGLLQAYGQYNYGGEQVSLIVIKAMRVGGSVAPTYDGAGLVFRGRRAPDDPAAGVIITNEHALDAGGYLAIKQGATDAQLFVVDYLGNAILGCALNSDGTGRADSYTCGSVIDATGKSGHAAVRAGPGLYLTTEGNLGDVCALLPDGGEPDPDGGSGYLAEHVTCDGGHCCFPYAGSHGNHTRMARREMRAGWADEVRNGSQPIHVITRTGAFGNPCLLPKSAFPRCPDVYNVPTSAGQFNAFGAFVGALQCAADEMALYVCKPWGWRKLKDEDG